MSQVAESRQPPDGRALLARRVTPLVTVGVVLLVLVVAVARLPQSFLRSLELGAPLPTTSSGDWFFGVLMVVTGHRARFWPFAIVAVVQGAWCFRQIGELAAWMSPQAPRREARRPVRWTREPPDYCPAMPRGLRAPGGAAG